MQTLAMQVLRINILSLFYFILKLIIFKCFYNVYYGQFFIDGFLIVHWHW